MAKIGELSVAITADDTQFKSALDSSAKGAQAFVSQITRSITSMGAAWKAVDLIKTGINFNSVAEQAQVAFGGMLKSTSEATRVLGELKTLTAKTPLEFKYAREAAQTLLQFNIKGRDVVSTIKMLGDVSGGNAEKLKSLSLAFGQMHSAGRLMGQDLLQMINAGFNPLQEISERTGESMISLKKKMEDGEISTAMVVESFQRATSEGGAFFNMMERQSKTLAGSQSNLNDAFETFLGSITKALNGPLKGLMDMATQLLNGFTALPEPIQAVIGVFAALSTAIGVAIVAARQFGFTLSAAFGPIGIAVAGVLALVTGVTAAVGQQEKAVYQVIESTDKMIAKQKQQALEAEKITGAITEQNKHTRLSQTQIEELIRVYPKLEEVLRSNVKTYGELNEVLKNSRTATINAEISNLTVLAVNQEAAMKKAKKAVDDYNKLTPSQQSQMHFQDIANVTSLKNLYEETEPKVQALRSAIGRLNDELSGIKNPSSNTKSPAQLRFEAEEKERQRLAKLREAEEKAALEERILDDKYFTEFVQENAAKSLEEQQRDFEEFLKKKKEAREKEAKEEFEIVMKYEQQIASGVLAFGQAVQALIGAATENRLRQIDEVTQAELEAAGLGEATAVQKAKDEYDLAVKSGDALLIKQKKDELKKQQIIEEGEKKKAQVAYEGAHAQWQLGIALAIGQAAQAIIVGFAQLGPIGGAISAGFTAAITGIQLGIMGENEPKPPKFWTGGIVPGSLYSGDQVPVQANSGEMMLSGSQQKKLFDMIANGYASGQGSPNITIQPAPVYIDGNLVAQIVFNEARNGRVRT